MTIGTVDLLTMLAGAVAALLLHVALRAAGMGPPRDRM